MADNKLMMKLIIEMKKTIKDVEQLAKSSKKATKDLDKQGKVAKKTSRHMKALGNHAKATSRHLRNIGFHTKSFIAALTGIGALAGIFFILGKALKEMVTNTIEGVQASAKLEAVLRATNHAIGLTKGQLDKMSLAMSQVTTFTQTSITEAQGIMATFTKLGRDTFPRAISAAADMSTMFGQTLQQSAIQLGTALNDPINGIGRLMRIGVSFSEQQKAQIKQFMIMNDVASAQGVILAELEREMGGTAEMVGTTLIGNIQQLVNAFALFFEQIGTILTLVPQFNEEIDEMVDFMYDLINTPIEVKIHKMSVAVLQFAADMINLWSVFQAVWNGISGLIMLLPALFRHPIEEVRHVFEKLAIHLEKLELQAKRAGQKLMNPFADTGDIDRQIFTKELELIGKRKEDPEFRDTLNSFMKLMGGDLDFTTQNEKMEEITAAILKANEGAMSATREQIKREEEDKKTVDANTDAVNELTKSWLKRAADLTAAIEAAGNKMDKLGFALGGALATGGSMRDIIGQAVSSTMAEIAATKAKDAFGDFLTAKFPNVSQEAGELGAGLTSLMGGLAGGLVGGLVGKLFSKKPKPVKKPIPVKVVNWGDMTQQLLKASSRRAVSPMITSGGNIGMSSTFNRDMRF